jgi:hypothetical protein
MESDEELKRAWSLFSKAILFNDIQALKDLSTDCIRCSACVTNTSSEDSVFTVYRNNNPDTWYDTLYGELSYIPLQIFLEKDLRLLFDANTNSRLLDSSKISFHDDNHNKGLYIKECIIKPSDSSKADIQEVLLTVIDPSSETEGMQKGFAFVKTEKGYKFCGYSTIP